MFIISQRLSRVVVAAAALFAAAVCGSIAFIHAQYTGHFGEAGKLFEHKSHDSNLVSLPMSYEQDCLFINQKIITGGKFNCTNLTHFLLHHSVSPSHQKDATPVKSAITLLYHTQPTHYQQLPLEIALTQRLGFPPSSAFESLRLHLPLGLHEEETQLYVAPYLIHNWQALPEDIQILGLTLIRSGLRQQPTRRTLLQAMASSGNISPFLKLSPNRATSEKMQKLLETLENADG